MKANNLAQTSTTTGTGNLTLVATGWNGCKPLSTFFTQATHRFEYTIQNDNGEKEKGIGYLSNSTTLVRERVIDNHLQTNALVNFSAGTKVVMCSTDAGSGIVQMVRSDGELCSLHNVSGTAGTVALTANVARLVPFWLHRPLAASAIGLNVTTVVASTTLRLAIYQITNVDTTNGYTFSLLHDAGSAASSGSAGNREFTLTNFFLGVGIYWLYAVSNGAPTVRSILAGSGSVGLNDVGGATANQFTAASNTGAISAAPATVTIAQPTANTTTPRIYLKGRYL